ncbi:MAG: WD40/YVTN/BNR-like repeat-containing protein [Acidimicrobiales bacterium]
MAKPLHESPVAEALLDNMPFRCIGPPRGGRSVAVAGDPNDVATFYFGAVAGGVWKATDAGMTWTNVTDGFVATSAVGALTVSDSDPNVIYAGMGESTIRGDVSAGDGVYRSTDSGKSWTHRGLAATRHISEIRVHPRNPDHVYAAAFGDAFGPNSERGIYRSVDGGRNWDQVLHVSDKAGAADLTFDPRNPDVLYATMWEAHRNFWELSSGGPDSGIWKSTDGGDTWTDITRNEGLPSEGLLGKIGIAASPVQAGRVWALVEAQEKPGLYRSDDFGETWEHLTENNDLRYRPWYYMHVFADTLDPDTVYVNNLDLWRSNDGGKTFTRIATPHGDNHDLWIDPADNRRMIQSNDGGANVSFNGGVSWSTIYNQLTAQLYTVTTDNREPYYHVYGTQQDNTSIAVPSDTNTEAIVWGDCYPAGTGESGYMAVHPDDDDIVYVGAVGSSPGGGGSLQRYDRRTGQIQLVNVWPEAHGGIGPGELRHRFPWTFPILFSPHDSGVLYTAGARVFRTTDEGHSWEAISPDLTTNDASKLGPSGGPITKDTSGAEHYCSIHTFRESPHEPGVLWAGSDDGLVHISRDSGDTWTDVTPTDLPDWSFVRTVEPSPHDPATLYVAATKYKLADNTPYLFKTTDYGETWRSITGEGEGALGDGDFVRVIRADPERAGLLYVGTETGLHVSFDDGGSWLPWNSNLPITPIYDLTFKQDDLVVATHGRSFWILDDLGPIRQLTRDLGAGDAAHLFEPARAWRVVPDLFGAWTTSDGKDYAIGLSKAAVFTAEKDDTGQVVRTIHDAGQGAQLGVTMVYHLPADDTDVEVSLDFVDANGQLVRSFEPKPDDYDDRTDEEKAFEPGPWIPTEAGINRFRWDLRHAGATRVLGNKLAGEANEGPLVLPGTYTARLRVGSGEAETVSEQSVVVVNDPRVDVSEVDLRAQLDLLLAIRDKIGDAHVGVRKIRTVVAQLEGWRARLSSSGKGDSDSDGDGGGAAGLVDAAKSTLTKLREVEAALIVPGEQKDTFRLDDPVRLNEKLSSLISIVASADAKPTASAVELVSLHTAEIDEQLDRLATVLDRDVAGFNTLVANANLPAVG